MKKKELTRYYNLSHQDILREFPEIAQLKIYCSLIRDYYNQIITEANFTQKLATCGLPADRITAVVAFIKTQRQIND